MMWNTPVTLALTRPIPESTIFFYLSSITLKLKIDFMIALSSDHAPASLIYSDSNLVVGPPKWRFQPKWLQYTSFTEYIGQKANVPILFNEYNTDLSLY